MLIVGVASLVAVDVTIIVIYLIVVGATSSLEARLVPFKENPEDRQGVSEDGSNFHDYYS
jgi:hypothetical protein